jgi:sucrose-phosphate synthase
VDAFGGADELRKRANLVLVVGNRDDLATMEEGPRTVLRDLLLSIDKHDLYGSVAYPKRHAPEATPDVYRLAARSGGLFVNPALTEPFGLTLLEAAASGVPVIATNDGGPRDILERCRNGMLVDPLNAEAMAAALLDALSDRARWRRWQGAGLRAVDRFYTWQGHARRYLREVEKILRRSRHHTDSVLRTRPADTGRDLAAGGDNSLREKDETLVAPEERLAAPFLPKRP